MQIQRGSVVLGRFREHLLILIRLNLLNTPFIMREKMVGFENFGSFGFLVLSSMMTVLDSIVLEVLVLYVLTSLSFHNLFIYI